MRLRDTRIAAIAMHYGVAWIPGKAVVALEEECGYRDWFWFSEMSCEELESWWSTLPTVSPYFYDPSKPEDGAEPLSGKLIQCCHRDEDKEHWAVFKLLADYQAHMHTDSDSYLEKTVLIYHKGYSRDDA